MEDFKMDIKGMQDLIDNLRDIGPRVANNSLLGAVKAAAKVVEKIAEDIAPVYDGETTIRNKKKTTGKAPGGLLKKQISRWKRNMYSNEVVSFSIGVKKDKDPQRAYWWTWQEFGTSRHQAANGGQGFLRPAFILGYRDAQKVMADYLRARLEKEAAKRGTT